jgi:hypothetical protein
MMKKTNQLVAVGAARVFSARRLFAGHGKHVAKSDSLYARLCAGVAVANALLDLRSISYEGPVTTQELQGALDAWLEAVGVEQVEGEMGEIKWRLVDPDFNDLEIS